MNLIVPSFFKTIAIDPIFEKIKNKDNCIATMKNIEAITVELKLRIYDDILRKS
jgi:hypothetical protein